MKKLNEFFYTVICIATGMIGYTIHKSIFWAFIDFLFAPIVWIKWLLYHEVSLSVIKETFAFFLK